MSVINQMLKDLENRNSEPNDAPINTMPSNANNSSKKLIVVGLALIVTFNLIGLFVWQLYKENESLKNTAQLSNNNNGSVVEDRIAQKQNKLNKSNVQKVQQQMPNSLDNTVQLSEQTTGSANNQNIDMSALEQDKIEQAGSLARDTQLALADQQLKPRIESVKQPSIAHLNKQSDQQPNNQRREQQTQVDDSLSVTEMARGEPEQETKPSIAISRRQLTPDDFAKQKMLQAEQAIEANQIAKAESLFEDILLVQPENKNARKQLAALWFGRQAYQPAINLLSQGIAIEPQNSEFRLMKARLYLAQGNANQAYQVLRALPATLDSEYQLTLANAAQQTGNFSGAINAYQVLVQLQPQNGRWWLGLAIAFDSDGQFKEAIQAYQSALSQGSLSDASLEFAQQRMLELGE